MDKKKIISSITLAGMLATSVAGSGVFAAETSDPATKALGEYSKLITGKVAVPFILQSETDRVTGKDVKASFKNATTFTFNSSALTDEQVLTTGDVVYVNGEPRTIVIYGDTNCDGKINIMDAVTVLNHVKGKTTLTDAAFAAADLNNNGSLNILEATGVLNVAKGKADYQNIATAPTVEVSVLKDVEISSGKIKLTFDMNPDGYSYKLSNKDGRVSGTIITDSKKDTNTGLYVKEISAATMNKNDNDYTIAILDKNGNEIASKTFTYREIKPVTAIDAGKGIGSENVKAFSVKVNLTNYNEVATKVLATLSDGEKTIETTANLPANTVATELNFGDVSALKDDENIKIKTKIVDADGNYIEDTLDKKIIKKVEAPKIFVESTSRTGTNTGKVTIKKTAADTVYVIAKKAGETAPTVAELKESANKIEPTDTFANVNITGDAYKVYVLAVNPQGTPSEIVVADIASSTAEKLTNVTNLKMDATNGVATWKDTNTNKVTGYTVQILKGSEIIKETTVNEAKYDISSIAKENGDATYTVKVRANGDNTTTANSEYETAKGSGYIVDPLEVTEAKFVEGIVSWKDVDAKAAEKVVVKLYKVTEMKSAAEIKDKKLVKEVNCANNTYSYDMNSVMKAEGNGRYVATVTLIAKADEAEVDSDETIATGTYYIAPAVTNVKATATDNTITVRFAPIDNIVGLDENYKLVYSSYNESDDTWSSENEVTISTTASDENDKKEFTITNATASTKYKFSIQTRKGTTVLAETSTMEVSTSATLVKGLNDYYTFKDISAKNAKLETDKTLGINYEGELMIKRPSTTAAENVDTAPNAAEIKSVIKMLKDGDKILIDANGKVSAIEITASSSVDRTVNLGTAVKDAALTIKAKANYNVIVNGEVKSVTVEKVTGETSEGKADLVGLTVTDKVTVEDATVDVKAGTTVNAKNATINGVFIKSEKTKAPDTKVVVPTELVANSANELAIKADNTTTVTLKADADKTVRFNGTQGDVTIADGKKEATLTLKTDADSSIGTLALNSAKTTVNIVDAYVTSNLHITAGTIVTDAIVNDTKKNIKVTPITGNATVEYTKDSSGKNDITNISGNVKIELTGLDGISEAITTETKLEKDISVVVVNEGVNATYNTPKATTATGHDGEMTITLTAGTITLNR